MASTTTDSGDNDSSDSSSGGMMDQIISFLTEPIGMGLIAGAGIAAFLLWRVF